MSRQGATNKYESRWAFEGLDEMQRVVERKLCPYKLSIDFLCIASIPQRDRRAEARTFRALDRPKYILYLT
jgi:hypothetical protein